MFLYLCTLTLTHDVHMLPAAYIYLITQLRLNSDILKAIVTKLYWYMTFTFFLALFISPYSFWPLSLPITSKSATHVMVNVAIQPLVTGVGQHICDPHSPTLTLNWPETSIWPLLPKGIAVDLPIHLLLHFL